MSPYVVKQGDYLLKVAHALGFDADTVWNDPKNADLQAKRDPNILCPGDILYVPDVTPQPLPIAGGTGNDYSATIPKTSVQLVFKNDDGPLANEPYVIDGLGDPLEGTTTADGQLTIEFQVHVRECRITFPGQNLIYPVSMGEMDPIEEDAGVRKRLQHLGYRKAEGEGDPEDMTGETMLAYDRLAIIAFQHTSGFPLTGTIDDDTKTALLKAHGS